MHENEQSFETSILCARSGMYISMSVCINIIIIYS